MSFAAPILLFFLALAANGADEDALALGSRPGLQTQRGLVIILRPAEIDTLTRTALARVTGELTAADFQTTFVTLDPGQDPTTQVETVAPESHAIAAFAIAHVGQADSRTIAIWVSDRVAERTSILRVTMNGNDISQNATSLALNAIELIRVSLAGLWPSPPQAADAIVLPATIQVIEASHRPQITVGLGLAAQQDVGLPSPQWMGSLLAMATWPGGFGIKAEMSGLGPALTLAGDYGTAAVHRQLGLLGLTWTFLRGPKVQSFIVVSGGVAHLRGEGSTTDPTRAIGRVGDDWSALVAVGLSASVHLGKGVWLGAELDGLASVPPLVIRTADTETKPFSRPGALAHVGLQFRF